MPRPALESRLMAAWPPENWAGGTVVVAVSGGADSVALLRAMAAVKPGGSGRLCVAHYNHRLRGAESHADERFVDQLAGNLGLECFIGHAETPARFVGQASGLTTPDGPAPIVTSDWPGRVADVADADSADGQRAEVSPSGQRPDLLWQRPSEAATRTERYAFLQSVAENLGARYVAVAHTADDQIESVLHRILRGTGLAGLAGMRRARPLGGAVALIRPLLEIPRADLRSYLQAIGQTFREDSTNAVAGYTRNRLRLDLLPLLAEQHNPNVGAALLRLSRLAAEAQGIVDRVTDELMLRCVVRAAAGVVVRIGPLAAEPGYAVRELFMRVWREQGWPEQPMGHAEWTALAALAQCAAESAQADFPGAVRATKTGEQLTLSRRCVDR